MSTPRGTAEVTRRRRKGFDPVRVWTATTAMLVGAAVAGLGVALLSWVVAVAGVVAVLVGGVQAVRAGIMRDVRVVGGDGLAEHEDTGPGGHQGDTSISPEAEWAGRRPIAAGPDVAVLAAWTAVVAGAWLMVAPFVLPYPFTPSGQDHVLRDQFLGLSVVLTTVPLARAGWLRPAVTGTAVLVAVLLGALGLASTGRPVVLVDEMVVAAVVLAALGVRTAALTWPAPPVR